MHSWLAAVRSALRDLRSAGDGSLFCDDEGCDCDTSGASVSPETSRLS